MFFIISYDISDSKTRQKIFKKLKDMATQSQRSVFEYDGDRSSIYVLIDFFKENINPETDSIFIQALCKHCLDNIAVLGCAVKPYKKEYEVI